MFVEFLSQYKELIDPARALVVHRPAIVFVYGGPVREKPDGEALSMRDRFVSWSHDTDHQVASLLRIPENYPEWNQFNGYNNLVDFERDAGCLSRTIVLFIESPGALAELGAFCTEQVLAERLFVILFNKHFKANSFVTLGPLRILDQLHGDDKAICPVDGEKLEDFEYVLEDVANEVFAKSQRLPKQSLFDKKLIRDQFLLVADMVELFGALKQSEIMQFLEHFGISLENPNARLTQMLNLLCLLNVIQKSEHLNRHFFVPSKSEREQFLVHKFLDPDTRFNRMKIKLKAVELMKHDSFRRKAYEKVHGQH